LNWQTVNFAKQQAGCSFQLQARASVYHSPIHFTEFSLALCCTAGHYLDAEISCCKSEYICENRFCPLLNLNQNAKEFMTFDDFVKL